MPGRDGRPSPLGQAFAEYRQIAKTLHLLALADPADAAVAALRSSSYAVSDEEAARLSPLGDKHINMLGRYAFAPPTGP